LLKSFADTLIAYGPVGVFLIGFIDSMGVPLPAALDLLLIAVAVETPQRAYFAALMAVVGSAGGNLTLFLLARSGGRRVIKVEPDPGKGKFRRWVRRYGLLTVFIPAVTPLVPLPLKVFVVSAGAMHTSLRRFLLVILLARVIRYFGIAYLGIRLGLDAGGFLKQNAWNIVGIALGVVLVVAVVIKWAESRRQTEV
jgi:membrane protein YqaA with SNARE-associated domain